MKGEDVMPKYTFLEIKEILNAMIDEGIEPELSLYIDNKIYMIIGYNDKCSFLRCGIDDGSGEVHYKTLDELYESTTVDNILLKRDWDKIKKFECTDYEWHYDEDF